MVNDPIADLLTRIRNANLRNHKAVVVPQTKMLESITAILKEEGYIEDFEIVDTEAAQNDIQITLKYDKGQPAIRKLERVSKPGLRIYKPYKAIPRVLNGLGINIFSTPKGVMTGEQAKTAKVGGEYLCNIW